MIPKKYIIGPQSTQALKKKVGLIFNLFKKKPKLMKNNNNHPITNIDWFDL
jgi:hypothetical protein